ncbi:major facilitator superfamily domain-containing protein [Gigaspora rosea]|uniref:Major facilitator superfamily domain-containing protein n=1 Tax=Gigaspora rosea TaxID=44941 RepID=A0A397W469_9GLOM|nr:major facilitator superfamily domain-containing protein [Gigaspora rosea]
MAIAIVYMTKEFNWNHTIQGYVSSAFFFGYFTTQIIGGALTDKFGGRKVLSIGEICLGVGEGATYPCVSSLISKWFPPEEQSRAISAVSVSHFIGMVITMPISNLLGSSQFGWPSIFWVSAIVGSIWSIIWYFYGRSDPKEYPGISKEELEWIFKNKSTACSEDNFGNYQSGSREYIMIIDDDHRVPKSENDMIIDDDHRVPKSENNMIIDDDHRVPKSENDMLLPKNQISSRPHYVHKIPWKLLFSHREVWAILLCDLFCSWGYFILLNWLPIFYYEYFHVDIHLIGIYTALPYLSYTIMGSIVGYICDYAIHQLKFHVLTATYLAKTSLEGLLMMTIGFALYSFKVSSYLVSHLDIAPKYAGVICGIRNTFGMVPAFFGIALTGRILEVTANDWGIIWCICSLFYMIGTAIYLAWAGGEVIID